MKLSEALAGMLAAGKDTQRTFMGMRVFTNEALPADEAILTNGDPKGTAIIQSITPAGIKALEDSNETE